MDYKFISENTLEYISLHDCVIDNVVISNTRLIFEFEHINVLPEHPLNNYTNAKYTNTAALIFENFEVIESILFDTSSIEKKHIVVEQDAVKRRLDIKDLATGFEVLQAEKKAGQEHWFVYEFYGIAPHKYRSDFSMITLKFSKVKVCWNELIGDSWFANGQSD
ncbi:MAG TPA: hypothetical protein PK033_07160 [Acetivibrio sp.]|nr:hypothetical protein [Clostridium sp.]HPT90131.1 hypothetical protein [Acetivibrio sp.]HQA57643.1 hypothetical protein [Acetivibrio sp.]